jgi:uncharacterized membrane protein (DUF485 family)
MTDGLRSARNVIGQTRRFALIATWNFIVLYLALLVLSSSNKYPQARDVLLAVMGLVLTIGAFGLVYAQARLTRWQMEQAEELAARKDAA